MKKFAALIILGLMCSSIAFGQVPPALSAPITPGRLYANDTANELLTTVRAATNVHELTAADVETFLDGIVPLQLEREDVAGATVAIVKDGKRLFAKGYGYADVKHKKPVTAETLFRPGSVSKLFTWTAVMQLVEQGKIDLGKDVNEYLDFKIPEAFGQPISLKNILTHTAGFEEQLKDLFTADKSSPNLGNYLKTHIPNRIFAPGTTPAYSNYAAMLAGYVVERVSGQPFNDYIHQNIFKPLGMTHSTFAQPLPPELVPLMSNGYVLASDEPKEFETIGPPAGSLTSSAADMSKFVLAHLQEGRLGTAQILKPETARLMHSRAFGLDPAANAMAYGFWEESRNGQRIIGHGGDTVLFHSDLHLLADAGVGFFVSYNSVGRGQIFQQMILWDAFLNRYFPAPPVNLPTLDSAKNDANAVSGNYIISRRSESLLKSLALLGEATVSANEDDTISVGEMLGVMNDANGKPKRWREVAPMTFRDINGQDSLIFKPDQNGRMQLILPYPMMVFQRVGLWENSRIILPVAWLSLFTMLLTLPLEFVAWLVRRHYRQPLKLTTLERRLRWAVRIVFALNLFFIVTLFGFLLFGLKHLELFSDSSNIWIWLIQSIGVLGTLGTIVVLYNAIYTWTSKQYQIWGKLQATMFALACLGVLWLVWAGHLLSFNSNY